MPDQPDQPKRPRGRPPAPPGKAFDVKIDGRVTQGQSEKYEAIGGIHWLRAMLDKYPITRLLSLSKPPSDKT